MAMIRRLLLTATQYNYPLLCAPIIITSKKHSLSADETFGLKHKKFFKETLGIDVDKKLVLKMYTNMQICMPKRRPLIPRMWNIYPINS